MLSLPLPLPAVAAPPRLQPPHAVTDTPLHHVWAGALAVGSGATVLTALLGSCVGVGIIWRRKKRCALAHCLLADAPAGTPAVDMRYVSNAIPGLLRALGAREQDYAELEVVAAGGASLFGQGPFPSKVGERNIAAFERIVRELGLRVIHQRLGGNEGSRITLHCASLTYDTRPLGKR
ncbi:chemotaxis protein CheD [Pseudoduganella lurida]|uniref:Chemotaxis protein CheD n=1 Tax=Pseudoduganella lurida TaxID=1036180 RepID=A0A562RJ22_9BURK|nr:chemotaxis protein CheD [Pseudoduganella lurida]TWI69082.1 chemotaxis protein CheD [Pseudoduganella lurida]